MPATTNATIVGSGIAGPVLAMFLNRAGIDARIVESRPEREGAQGAFLGVAPNGMNVLRALGVGDAVAARGFACDGFVFRNARGERIASIDRREDSERLGSTMTMIKRADLHEILVGEARSRGVDVRFGRRLERIVQDTRGVRLGFDDGDEERAEIVVGCDGIRSTIRTAVLPGSPSPRFTGLVDLAGCVHFPNAPLEVGWNEMYFGRRAFFGAFKTKAGEVWWFHNEGAPARTDSVDQEALRARVLALHSDDSPLILEIVRRTKTILGPYPLHDILMLPRWHAGRVCLAGDAAHATTPSAGQGASMAIEDGAALARCLRDARHPEAAFEEFERSRRERVQWVVRQSRRMGSTKATSNRVSEWLRDRLLPYFLRLGARDQERAYAHRERFE
jgi:FAD-dependent urate hydroxylase